MSGEICTLLLLSSSGGLQRSEEQTLRPQNLVIARGCSQFPVLLKCVIE